MNKKPIRKYSDDELLGLRAECNAMANEFKYKELYK